ncbi:MAG: HAD family hydrolase [Endomicrobiia bacterium]|nr:HAD family hydrolase [Endomicrobiia bacterium]
MAPNLKAVILDRDGTLIVEKNYLRRVGDVNLIPGAARALASLRRAGYTLIIATNQSGVARGYLKEKKLRAINRKLSRELAARGATISAVYYCPHPVDGKCGCRKPATGMIEAARKRFGFDPKRSFCVGDKITDVEFGHNAGMKSALVLSGYGAEELADIRRDAARATRKSRPDFAARDIGEAVEWILSQKK